MGELNGLLSPMLRKRRLGVVPRDALGGRTLDIGCGTGSLADQVSPENYVGVDVDQTCLEIARERFPKHMFLSLSDFQNDPAHKHFDCIVGLAIIEHIDNQAQWLSDLLSRLNPDGTIILTTPSPIFRLVHDIGARIGLFAHEAAEEHTEFLDLPKMKALAQRVNASVTHYRKFLGGANQVFVLKHHTGHAKAI
jgi:2-polyprenyl-3-methyl-5-hydroxy-6-metoxy-1,4-benzoquinol methylase